MKNLIIIFFLLFSSAAFSQTKKFTVSGKIKGLDTEKIYFYLRDPSFEGGIFRDSIAVKDEQFSYTTNLISQPTFIALGPGVDRVVKRVKNGGYYPAKSSQLQFIASPGATIHFKGAITDFVDAYPSGDEPNDDLAKLNSQVFPLMNHSVNLQLMIANKMITDPGQVKGIQNAIKQLDEVVVSIKEQFISNHLSSVAAAWLLSDMMLRTQISNDKAIEIYGMMDEKKLKDVPFFKEVSKRVNGIIATAVGKQVPDISSMNTYNNKKFELASLRGKYVVIDFWGTWCGPCVAGMPKMKAYLDKYKDKLELVGVAQESDNGKRWRNFLDKNPDYQWHQVLSRSNEDYILKFSVAGFPTKIIVDPEGKIVERFVGEDEGIYKKLDEILN